jgi:hypothetical protein
MKKYKYYSETYTLMEIDSAISALGNQGYRIIAINKVNNVRDDEEAFHVVSEALCPEVDSRLLEGFKVGEISSISAGSGVGKTFYPQVNPKLLENAQAVYDLMKKQRVFRESSEIYNEGTRLIKLIEGGHCED